MSPSLSAWVLVRQTWAGTTPWRTATATNPEKPTCHEWEIDVTESHWHFEIVIHCNLIKLAHKCFHIQSKNLVPEAEKYQKFWGSQAPNLCYKKCVNILSMCLWYISDRMILHSLAVSIWIGTYFSYGHLCLENRCNESTWQFHNIKLHQHAERKCHNLSGDITFRVHGNIRKYFFKIIISWPVLVSQ